MIHHHTPPGIQCAIRSLRPDVAGIEYAETGYQKWIATDARTLKVYHWHSFNAAYTGIADLIKAGHVLAIGIAQIKNTQFYRYRVTLSSALDPCGAARALSSALQKNLAWAAGAGFGRGQTFAAAAAGYTSGQLIPQTQQTKAYVQTALDGRARYERRF